MVIMQKVTFYLCFFSFITTPTAFLTSFRFGQKLTSYIGPSSSSSAAPQSNLIFTNRRQKLYASQYADILDEKTQAELDEDEISMILREFNITDDVMRSFDEDLNPKEGKEFFETMVLRPKKQRRTVMEAKIDFYEDYRTPILPQYKTFISEFLTVLLLQIEDGRYQYDPLHAFGICTHYYTIMKGYPLEDEVIVPSKLFQCFTLRSYL